MIETAIDGVVMRTAFEALAIEQEALATLRAALDQPDLAGAFARSVHLVGSCQGRLVVTGMGKSGLVGRKIAATMSSTGTPSLFINPAEASHGDLGMVASADVVLAITWSGETTELGDIIAYCRRYAVPLIVMTSRAESTAARAADVCITLPVVREACPHQLAPTSSTIIQAALGDALAVALVSRRGFTESDFLRLHPGGRLSAQLVAVESLMGRDEEVPTIAVSATMIDATVEMSRKRYGSTAIVDRRRRLVGVLTDGDLRRAFAGNALDERVDRHMTRDPLTVAPDTLSSDALRIMNENAVSVLFVCETGGRLVGALHLHDLLRAGIA